MKTVLSLATMLLLSGVARAEWKDLKPGMDQQAALKCAGTPMLLNRARGTEVWTYDRRGYILFEGGRVTYWEQPKVVKPEFSALAYVQTKPAAKKPTVVVGAGTTAKSSIVVGD